MLTPLNSRKEQEAWICQRSLNRIAEILNHLGHASLFKSSLDALQLVPSNITHQSELDRLLREIRRACPSITMRLMAQMALIDLGVLGYAIASCGTLNRALETLVRYHDLTANRFYMAIEHTQTQVIIYPMPKPDYLFDSQDIAEDCLIGSLKMIEQLVGAGIARDHVTLKFAHRRPSYFDGALDFMPTQCIFESARSELCIQRSAGEVAVSSANPVVAEMCAVMCRTIFGVRLDDRSAKESVTKLLIHRIDNHIPSLEEAASLLNQSASQLRKRLYREQTTYKKIVLDVRMLLASHYLKATRLSVQEIAYLLDYSQPAPFSRAYKHYFGHSPTDDRALALQSGFRSADNDC